SLPPTCLLSWLEFRDPSLRSGSAQIDDSLVAGTGERPAEQTADCVLLSLPLSESIIAALDALDVLDHV
ncbi:hypothetical protein M9458_041149, partial [Cirrhinus mrigala]